MSLRAGIIGCGNIANNHIEGYRKNGITITAVTDINRSAAESIAAACRATAYCDLKAMLESGTVDIVSVCTPPNAHEDTAVSALKAGIHVLLEKPLAHTTLAAQNILHATRSPGSGRMMVAFRHRFIEANKVLKKIVDSGEIGAPVFFKNIFCSPAFQMKDKWFSRKAIAGGGTMIDTSSHSVDLFNYFFGDISDIRGLFSQRISGIDVEDTGMIILKSNSGVIGTLTSSWAAGISLAMTLIMGEKGCIHFNYNKPDQVTIRTHDSISEQTIAVTPSDGFSEQISHFIQAIRSGKDPEVTAEDSLKILQLIQSVYDNA